MPAWLNLYYEEPIALERGEGCHVWDTEGNRYLDFFGGIVTTISGHNVPEIVEAVQDQAGKILHSSTLYLIESQVALAEKIRELAPVDDPKVYFLASGTEAIDTALLLATSYRRSNQVLAMRNSYHGRSFSAVSITGNRSWSATGFSPLQVSYVHGAYPYRSPFGHFPPERYVEACVGDLEEVIHTTTSGDVACLIAEPIQGVGGFAYPPDGLYGAFKDVLDDYGIPFISDETQTGWGRTGEHFWGIDAHDVRPDLMTFAKGIGNGLALAGVVARADIMDSLFANSISTFGGNPLATAGALANLDYLLAHDLQSNAAKVGDQLATHIRHRAAALGCVGDVRGKGLMLAIELVRPGTKEPDPVSATAMMEACKRRGLLIGKGGLYGNVLRLTPPLTLTPEEAKDGSTALIEALEEVQRSGS
jgi:4-aminobutyrate aminotransferase